MSVHPGPHILDIISILEREGGAAALSACDAHLAQLRGSRNPADRRHVASVAMSAADLVRKTGGSAEREWALLDEASYLARRWPDVQAWLRASGNRYLLAMNLGVAAAGIGRWPDAVDAHREAFDHATTGEHRAKARVYLAWDLLHLGLDQADEARQHVGEVCHGPLRAHATSPIVSQALQAAAVCLFADDDRRGALAALQEAILLDPSSARAGSLLARARQPGADPTALHVVATSKPWVVQASAQARDAASTDTADATGVRPTTAQHTQRVGHINRLISAAQYDSAIQAAREWHKSKCSGWSAFEAALLYSRALARGRRVTEAIAVAGDALAGIAEAPDDAMGRCMRARAWDQLAELRCLAGDPVRALTDLRRAEQELEGVEAPPRPLRADMHHTLGMITSALGSWAEARRAFGLALDLHHYQRGKEGLGCAVDAMNLALSQSDAGHGTSDSLEHGIELARRTLPLVRDSVIAERIRMTQRMLETRLTALSGAPARAILAPWLTLFADPQATPTTDAGRALALRGLGDAAIRALVGRHTVPDRPSDDLARAMARLAPMESAAPGTPPALSALILRLRATTGRASTLEADGAAVTGALQTWGEPVADDGAALAGTRDRGRLAVDVVAALAARHGSITALRLDPRLWRLLDRGRPRQRTDLVRRFDVRSTIARRHLRAQIAALGIWSEHLARAGRGAEVSGSSWGVETPHAPQLQAFERALRERYPDLAMLGTRAHIQAHGAALEAKLAVSGRPAPADSVSSSSISWRAIADRLGADDRVLEYHVGRYGLLAVVIGPTAAHAVALDVDLAALNDSIGALRTAADPTDHSTAEPPARSLKAISRQLMPPAVARLLPTGDAGRVFVVPDGALWAVPFPWLLLDGRPSFQRYSTVIVPSPALLGPTPRHALDQPGIIACHGASLAAAADETARVRQSGPWAVIGASPDDPATPRRLLDALGDVPRVHVIAHGCADEVLPSMSGLELASVGLAEGRLMVEDIADAKCRAELVYLSACCGVTMKVSDALVETIAHSLLAAGARWVVGSLWPCLDADAPLLADAFYRALDETGDIAAAHRACLQAANGSATSLDDALRRFGHSVLMHAGARGHRDIVDAQSDAAIGQADTARGGDPNNILPIAGGCIAEVIARVEPRAATDPDQED